MCIIVIYTKSIYYIVDKNKVYLIKYNIKVCSISCILKMFIISNEKEKCLLYCIKQNDYLTKMYVKIIIQCYSDSSND